MKKVFAFLLGPLFSCIIFYIVYKKYFLDFELESFLKEIVEIKKNWLFLALIFSSALYPLNSYRLQLILRLNKIQIPYFSILRVVWFSSFLALIMPAAIFSDGFKVALLKVNNLLSVRKAVIAIFIDRAFGFLFILPFTFSLLIILPLKNSSIIIYALSLVLVIILLLALVFFLLQGSRNRNSLNLVLKLFESNFAVKILLISILNIILVAITLWSLSRGISLELTFLTFLILAPCILVINSLPFLYQGFGGREAFMLYCLSGLIPLTSSGKIISISICFGVLAIWAAFLGFIFAAPLLIKNIKIKL